MSWLKQFLPHLNHATQARKGAKFLKVSEMLLVKQLQAIYSETLVPLLKMAEKNPPKPKKFKEKKTEPVTACNDRGKKPDGEVTGTGRPGWERKPQVVPVRSGGTSIGPVTPVTPSRPVRHDPKDKHNAELPGAVKKKQPEPDPDPSSSMDLDRLKLSRQAQQQHPPDRVDLDDIQIPDL